MLNLKAMDKVKMMECFSVETVNNGGYLLLFKGNYFDAIEFYIKQDVPCVVTDCHNFQTVCKCKDIIPLEQKYIDSEITA